MISHIDLDQNTAETLAKLQTLTGRSAGSILGGALDAELVRVEKEAIRAAILAGAAEADAGKFTALSVDEIFEIGIARAKQPATTGN
ncbi:hypothetical protein [Niveispirillum cyanobacteriorum]|uniref:Uncharacterized protein n=1 Tax=Niveispirillum cyanobacteriorum TaxID=1612173 RepID=A0A2K9N8T8_9PROT|nr:hypothetical protein [Niveispirillum cyanobacteriorum]AUN29561.1 hypothetical protein C0V82_04455 [Niveispirillum cyanobacteriorum]GGE63193.1 hypothetical protein GCM10011317_20830 [Niveispirillum cyanobacteriorum]